MPENVYTYARNFGQLKGEVLQKLWTQLTYDYRGWPEPLDYPPRMSEQLVSNKINQALMEIATFGSVLKGWFVIPTKQGRMQYPVPQNIFDIIPPIYFFITATYYQPLKVHDEGYLDESLYNWFTETATNCPRYAFKGNWNRMNRYLGITPPPNVDADAITIDPSIIERVTPVGAMDGITAVAAPESTSTDMVDANSTNFVLKGIIPGMTLLNVTDGSKGVIDSITTTLTTNDTIVVDALTGGSTNTFNPADECRIIGGEYGGISKLDEIEATYLISPNVATMPTPGVTMAAGNMLVKAVLYPALLENNDQYPELPQWAHTLIAVRAAGLIAKTFPIDSPEYAQGDAYVKESEAGIALLRGAMAEHFQLNQPMQIQSKRK